MGDHATSRRIMAVAAKWAPHPRTHCGCARVAYAMQATRLKGGLIVKILPTYGTRHLRIRHLLAFAFALAASMRACLAFDALHPHAQHTPRAKTEGIVERHIAAGAGLRGHVDACFAQQRRTLVARIHALEALDGAAFVTCCAAFATHATHALAAPRGTAHDAIAVRNGSVHFKREEGREDFFFH